MTRNSHAGGRPIDKVAEEQRALNAILRVSLEDIPLAQQLERVLDILLDLSWLPIEPKGGIFLTERGKETLALTAQRGLHPALLTACAKVPFGHCLCGRAGATGEIQFASCVDERHEINYAGMGPHGHYNVPIVLQREVLGVIVLYLKHGHRQQASEVEFLGSVAATLAGLIEHRRTQDALGASRARLAEAQRIARLGSWEWLVGDDRLTFADGAEDILGLPPGQHVRTLDDWLKVVHPDDRHGVKCAIDLAITNGTTFDMDCRILRADGNERYVHGRAEAAYDGNDRALRLVGSVQDITGRKQMEERLRQSATVFENTAEGVIITDAANHIIAVNRACSEITGFSEPELLGNTPAMFRSGRHDEKFFNDMLRSVMEAGRWQGEIWNRRKNGDIYPEWLNVSVVKDEHGRVTHMVQVFSDISAMKESESKLDHLAHHDTLTGLPNRMLLTARMEQSLARAKRNGAMLALLFVDLDRFKDVNDTLGHPIGDMLLQAVSKRLMDCVREEDTVSRLGGDEFTMLIEDLHNSSAAGTVAQKVNVALEQPFMLQGHEIFISSSIGIALFPNDGADVTALIKNADSALYRAKEQGRNNYQYYTEELTARAIERLAMENDLRHAIERNELLVHYQPQVDLYSGKIIGMEALVRWQHPQRGLVMPSDFIPLAEDTGIIMAIGEWVMRTACARVSDWIAQGYPPVRVAVNLSSRQFNQRQLAEIVQRILNETGLEPQYLELELTERLIMQDAEHTITILRKLKKLGVQFSIDDFGTGYSSLSYLKQFPIDRIKIDQSFVRNITSDPEDAAVSQAIISLSHSLNLKTVAEGVETLEQQEFLRARQCDEMQGFYFSRPVSEQEMEGLMRDGVSVALRQHELPHQERVLLLVDDEGHVLESLARALKSDGYRILHTTDPREALNLLATNRVGVIVSDQMMPEMSGVELLRKARQLHPNTIRIMLTAYTDSKLIADAINEGAVYKFIFKPWDNDMLRDILRQAFATHATLVSAGI